MLQLYEWILEYYFQHHHQQQQQAPNGTSGAPMGPAGVMNSGASGGAMGQGGGGGGGAGGTPSENETNNIIHKLMCHRQVTFITFSSVNLVLGRRRRILCKTGN